MIRRHSSISAIKSRWCAGLLAATACCSGIAIAQSATGYVDFEKANDYYAARGSNRLEVVEQYHLGPCETRFRERDWQRAMSECNFILKIFPNHPHALLIEAQICEQWQSGLCMLDDTFRRAMEVNPKAPGTFIVQGIYLSRTKQYGAAITSFKTALELDPDQVNAHYNLALTYLDTKQLELANQHAQRAYALGAALPGLRNLLEQAGYWKPMDPASMRIDSGRVQPGSPPTTPNSKPGAR